MLMLATVALVKLALCALQTYPHDPNAFTQGLEYDQICDSASPASCQDIFWESTGVTPGWVSAVKVFPA